LSFKPPRARMNKTAAARYETETKLSDTATTP
jgi:hypothetical protein